MQLYFIRHGQSANNAGWGDPGYKESPDPELTEIGVQQAKILAEFLEKNQPITRSDDWNIQNQHGFGITRIYASLMERAVHTASYAADRLSQIPFEAWDIHESGGIFGRDGDKKLIGLPGNPRSFFEQNFPVFKLPEALDESGWWRERPFETEEECQVRAERIWADLLSHHGDKDGQPQERIAFVSHGGFFVHLMSVILNMPWRGASNGLKSWFLLNNCSISRIDVKDEHVTICYLNRTNHLPGHLIT
jgi:2,3-bisphosphoglycerate-dependent phosphoglycerate mutase